MLYIIHHWWLPLLGCFVWWGMLLGMIIWWVRQGKPVYQFMAESQKFVYISDIGATKLQPLFIAGAAVQAAFFTLALISERYLRHAGRLLPNYRTTEKVLSGLAIFWGIVGQIGIILVACFNCHYFSRVHYAMLLVFLVGMALSIISTSLEFFFLDRAYERVLTLRISYAFKIVFIIAAIILAILFGVFNVSKNKSLKDPSAAIEWALAFWYGFYLVDLTIDLLPAAKRKKGDYLNENPYLRSRNADKEKDEQSSFNAQDTTALRNAAAVNF